MKKWSLSGHHEVAPLNSLESGTALNRRKNLGKSGTSLEIMKVNRSILTGLWMILRELIIVNNADVLRSGKKGPTSKGILSASGPRRKAWMLAS
jgi:hypothetical protein